MGVIDCHAPEGSHNPVTEHIEKHRFREIDFLVLSHPHYDHYSGLRRILEHCMGQGIVIRRFGHTARAAPDYIRAVVMSDEKKRSLVKLFMLVKELEASGLIVDRGLITDQVRPIPLGERVSLSFLAPSEAEYDEYLKSLYDDAMNLKSNPNANWLCTVGMV